MGLEDWKQEREEHLAALGLLMIGEQTLPTGPLGPRCRPVRAGRDAGPQRCKGVE